jgi:NADH:ubiquinone oxidoreductase subunit 5 (subunit L)/multisubunit Na+/H+ antiporter MnhA subunit
VKSRRESIAHGISAFVVVALALLPLIAHAYSAADVIHIDPLFGTEHGAAIAITGDGPWIAALGNLLALSVLAFARRYLHAERGFTRFAVLYLVFVIGFDLVAVGASLDIVLGGWELVGLASTFLIGFYGDRSSARRNAVFAFAVYRVADIGLLFAAIALHHDRGTLSLHALPMPTPHTWVFAGGLLIAAACKSSQFPFTSLFARSMEGPTPTSALGYAGLSAHIGIVLLARTRDLWFPSDAARLALLLCGIATAVHAQLVAGTRADRKGVLGYATAGAVGVLFVLLATGFDRVVLVAAFGHAALRIIQVLRAPSALADAKRLQAALGDARAPWVCPLWLYRITWGLRRFDHDLPELVLDVLSPVHRREGPLPGAGVPAAPARTS